MLRVLSASTNVLCTRSAVTAIKCVPQIRYSSRTVDIIFTQEVPDFANKGEQRTVKSAFARNVLFPRKLAVIASPEAIEDFGGMTQQIGNTSNRKRNESRKAKKTLATVNLLQIPRKQNKELGSPDPITPEVICEKLLLLKGIKLAPEQVKLNEPIAQYRKPIPVQIEIDGSNFSVKVEMLP